MTRYTLMCHIMLYLHANIGDSISCTSLSISLRKSTVISNSPLIDVVKKNKSTFYSRAIPVLIVWGLQGTLFQYPP